MPVFCYRQLDVFAARRGGGNPLGVVLDADGWSDAAMQAFARWTNLVETTFVSRPTLPEADYRLRIFTPHKEIPFAGHPSVGSAHAWLDAHFPQSGRQPEVIRQQCAAGVLPLRIAAQAEGRIIAIQAPRAEPVAASAAALAAVYRLLEGQASGALAPALVDGGRRWWLAELADETQLRHWRPDHSAVAALASATDSLGLCVFARCAAADYQLVVRAFPAGVGIVEDPASGAANGLIAAWIARQQPESELARGYRVSQGREIGHDARIDIQIDADGAVWVGGITYTIINGQVEWEPTT